MAEKLPSGLVGRVAEVLESLPLATALAVGRLSLATQSENLNAAERRARLALRIALMRQDKPLASAPDETETAATEANPQAVPEPVAVVPEPPQPKPEPAPPPPPKPARVSLSTVRLEDAAMLLAAASAPPEPAFTPALRVAAALPETSAAPEPPVQPEPAQDVSEAGAGEGETIEPAAPKAPRRKSGARKWSANTDDLGDAFAALSALGSPAEEASAPDPAPAPPEPELPVAAPPKSKKRSGSISAADGLAAAASAFAALQMADPDEDGSSPSPAAGQDASADAGFFGDQG
ncbi:hypothetical protein [Pseudotabrizicola algicola]|uniref:Uncharacterized protein n=1 Tax=Pseudotabrizicola algicola TaxID=2709381 RepID=A0A6B3RGR0_9RHOB|nr:hypothetical protein [Pseudotabrizicola algicola]NEX45244.1 hypothetical protein [Pseudotabrizicola algicola]